MWERLTCLKRNALQDVKEKEPIASAYWKRLKNVKDIFKNIEAYKRQKNSETWSREQIDVLSSQYFGGEPL